MRTLVLITHDHLEDSSTHQFLMASGKAMTQVDYIDLKKELREGVFHSGPELDRLFEYDRIIFQFNMIWYQAPSLLKQWIDQVFDENLNLAKVRAALKNKELGIVVAMGVKADAYQLGGHENVTVSELMAPLAAFARYFDMKFLPIFDIYQFAYKSESEKMELLVDYTYYLSEGKKANFQAKQIYVIERLESLGEQNLLLSDTDTIIFQTYLQQLMDHKDQLDELVQY